jgi:hypothetical protein
MLEPIPRQLEDDRAYRFKETFERVAAAFGSFAAAQRAAARVAGAYLTVALLTGLAGVAWWRHGDATWNELGGIALLAIAVFCGVRGLNKKGKASDSKTETLRDLFMHLSAHVDGRQSLEVEIDMRPPYEATTASAERDQHKETTGHSEHEHRWLKTSFVLENGIHVSLTATDHEDRQRQHHTTRLSSFRAGEAPIVVSRIVMQTFELGLRPSARDTRRVEGLARLQAHQAADQPSAVALAKAVQALSPLRVKNVEARGQTALVELTTPPQAVDLLHVPRADTGALLARAIIAMTRKL